jgi:hypothetical protein
MNAASTDTPIGHLGRLMYCTSLIDGNNSEVSKPDTASEVQAWQALLCLRPNRLVSFTDCDFDGSVFREHNVPATG